MHARLFRLSVILFAGQFFLTAFSQAETIPPPPRQPVVDAAGVIPDNREQELDRRLAQFERETSNQIVVAVYPKMDSESSIEDYTVRIAEAWKVGQKDKNNGAILFVFVNDHKMRIEVGYGLEGALPDGVCFQIIENRLKPAFRRGDFTGGIEAAVTDMIAATKGEYQGTGQTAGEQRRKEKRGFPIFPVLFFIIVMSSLFGNRGRRRRNVIFYSGSGYHHGGWGGGFGGGGGGGFSGGGGGFGGGGASGSW